jgi:hypothetical protein
MVKFIYINLDLFLFAGVKTLYYVIYSNLFNTWDME